MYQNPYTPGFEVLSKSGYSLDQSSSSASYLTTNNFPDYTAMFYSPTEHEAMTSIKYGNFEQDYSNLREVQQSLNGPPLEFYIPHSFNVADGSGSNDLIQIDSETIKNKLMDKVHEEALKEIENAQREVKGKRIKRIEVEDVLLLRKRKMTIVFEDKEQDI